jgi:hypothetical protein
LQCMDSDQFHFQPPVRRSKGVFNSYSSWRSTVIAYSQTLVTDSGICRLYRERDSPHLLLGSLGPWLSIPYSVTRPLSALSSGTHARVEHGTKECYDDTAASDYGFTPSYRLPYVLLSPIVRKRVSVDCGTPNRQFDCSAINKNWPGPLLAHRPELMLLTARVKLQSLLTVL